MCGQSWESVLFPEATSTHKFLFAHGHVQNLCVHLSRENDHVHTDPHVHTMWESRAGGATHRRSDLSRLLRKNSIINAAAGRIGILHLSGRTSYLPATGCDVLGGCADTTLRCHFGATHDGGG